MVEGAHHMMSLFQTGKPTYGLNREEETKRRNNLKEKGAY